MVRSWHYLQEVDVVFRVKNLPEFRISPLQLHDFLLQSLHIALGLTFTAKHKVPLVLNIRPLFTYSKTDEEGILEAYIFPLLFTYETLMKMLMYVLCLLSTAAHVYIGAPVFTYNENDFAVSLQQSKCQ